MKCPLVSPRLESFHDAEAQQDAKRDGASTMAAFESLGDVTHTSGLAGAYSSLPCPRNAQSQQASLP